jgi:hypothetical protein
VPELWADMVGVVGYVDGEAVSTASVMAVDEAACVCLVATQPEHQGKGYAEAVSCDRPSWMRSAGGACSAPSCMRQTPGVLCTCAWVTRLPTPTTSTSASDPEPRRAGSAHRKLSSRMRSASYRAMFVASAQRPSLDTVMCVYIPGIRNPSRPARATR